jgi:hypothetical protein
MIVGVILLRTEAQFNSSPGKAKDETALHESVAVFGPLRFNDFVA